MKNVDEKCNDISQDFQELNQTKFPENIIFRTFRGPITLSLIAIKSRSQTLRRWFWKRMYEFLAGYKVPQWVFMNYGFDDGNSAIALKPEDEADRYFIQLYHRVAAAVNLNNLDVLEVGCGRGGGASYVQRYLQPNSMMAVDFSPKVIEYCRQTHNDLGLTFRVDNAESLSFESESFDVVLNVESSHCYGSVQNFLEQVKRILRPGGFFLHADVGLPTDNVEFRRKLDQAGLLLLEEENITESVLRALTLDNSRKISLIHKYIPRWFQKQFQQLAGVQGSEINEMFRNGQVVYMCRKIQRPR